MRLEVCGGKVLDITLSRVTREVCKISLEPISFVEEKSITNISFDFLDYLDGGLIQIITEGQKAQLTMKGTIIGMPEGIRGEDSKKKTSGSVDPIGLFVAVIYLAAFGSIPVIYQKLNGGAWNRIITIAISCARVAITSFCSSADPTFF